MSVKKNGNYSEKSQPENVSTGEVEGTGIDLNSPEKEMADDTGVAERAEETVDYSNRKITSTIAWGIWLVITAANVYALVEISRNPP
jgi:Mn2+/Fe2+ NRAMP family transporter